MAATKIALGQQISVGTTPVEYTLDTSLATLSNPQDLDINMAAGNAGTIKFAVGVTPPVGQFAWPSSSRFTMHGIRPGRTSFWAVGSVAAQVFIVT